MFAQTAVQVAIRRESISLRPCGESISGSSVLAARGRRDVLCVLISQLGWWSVTGSPARQRLRPRDLQLHLASADVAISA